MGKVDQYLTKCAAETTAATGAIEATFAPGAFAMARSQAGNDICAAALLFRLKWHFDPKHKSKKLQRFGKDWIAKSRAQWAIDVGLTDAEMKNRALPKLKAFPFVTIRAMCLEFNSPKLIWMHLDLVKLHEWTLPPDMQPYFPAGVLQNGDATINYPYKLEPGENYAKEPKG
jgi:hypothetical protein